MVLTAQHTANVTPPAVVAPSILASDFANLGADSQRVLDSGADWLHVDVMDGHFVPNLSLGTPVIDSLHKALPNAFLDCHMMVAKPEQWINDVAKAGGSSYTFHYEATKSEEEALELTKQIHDCGMKAAMAINPATESNVISEKLGNEVEMILVMTVWPGKGGQKFMEECTNKVTELRNRFPHTHIEVDGGVGPSTIHKCAHAGANVAVGGTAIFGAKDPKEAITTMRTAIEESSPNWTKASSKA